MSLLVAHGTEAAPYGVVHDDTRIETAGPKVVFDILAKAGIPRAWPGMRTLIVRQNQLHIRLAFPRHIYKLINMPGSIAWL